MSMSTTKSAQGTGLGQMSFHTRTHLTSSSKGSQRCNSERKESNQQQNNSFSAHIPMWRLSRLQNLAISPLATILLLEKQPHSEQDWGMTEHPKNHTGSRSGTAEIAYSQLWRWLPVTTPARACWALTALQLRGWRLQTSPDAREEILN